MSLTTPEPHSGHHDPTEPQGPVRWFGLTALYISAKEASAATKFARLADARQAQAAVTPAYVYDLSTVTEEKFSIDYVTDTGDGYDATFAIARSVDGSIDSDPTDDVDGTEAPSDRAHLVMLGGDEVYPVASVKEYKNRLSRPFADAVRPTEGKGFLAAIPGNHDWYDGLNAFRRNFCESFLKQIDKSGPPPEFMQTPAQGKGDEYLDRSLFQTRSYFSVKLPHGWWLWGVDSQLDSYIDVAQLAYFKRARELIQDHERVIICFPRPSWTDDPDLDKGYFLTNRETMTWFVHRMFPDTRPSGIAQVALVISGDKHHYTRYVMDPEQSAQAAEPDPQSPVTVDPCDAPRQLVTCGGGGAYLSSTHHTAKDIDIPWHQPDETTTRYSRASAYPSIDDSINLRRKLYRIPFVNGLWFPLLLAIVDAALLPLIALIWHGPSLGGILGAIGWFIVVGGLLGGFSAAFGPKRKPKKLGFALGLALALSHLAMVTGVYGVVQPKLEWTPWWIIAVCLAAVVAWATFSLFLFLCDTEAIHWHENEFFSGMKLETYKSHLRITIEPPQDDEVTGQATVVVHVIKDPPKNRKHGTKNSPIVKIHEAFNVDDLSLPEVSNS